MVFQTLNNLLDKFHQSSSWAHATSSCITAFGAIVLLCLLIRLILYASRLTKLYIIDQLSSCCSIDLQKEYGKWALITGATDGIGLEFARALAARGMSLVIVARNEEKLAKTKSTLEQLAAGRAEIVTIKKDFGDSSPESYEKLRKKIDPDHRDIGVLINNVGTYLTDPRRFTKVAGKDLKTMIDVNVISTVMLTRLILPSMIERNRGLVVNVSSVLSCVSGPYLGVYSASKSFINTFSKQMQFEYRNCLVKFVNLTTGPVDTGGMKKFIDSTKMKREAIICSTDLYARRVLNCLSKCWSPTSQFSGTLAHELMRTGLILADSLGIDGYMTESRFYANIELTPVVSSRNLEVVTRS